MNLYVPFFLHLFFWSMTDFFLPYRCFRVPCVERALKRSCRRLVRCVWAPASWRYSANGMFCGWFMIRTLLTIHQGLDSIAGESSRDNINNDDDEK